MSLVITVREKKKKEKRKRFEIRKTKWRDHFLQATMWFVPSVLFFFNLIVDIDSCCKLKEKKL